MTRVFLDANVLFSAAWRESSSLLGLWDREDVKLVTSPYARAEAERNILLKKPEAGTRLSTLVSQVETSAATATLTEDCGLPAKDFPILESAVGSGCSVLLTGDVTHFGHLIGTEVEGVRILTPSMFLTGTP